MMGEYARDSIMGRHGVDIGDDYDPPRKNFKCPRCGKPFIDAAAVAQHQKMKHEAKGKA